MPSSDIEVRIQIAGERELRSLAQNLREAGMGKLQRELNSELRQSGQPVIAQLRGAVLAVQVTSSRDGMGTPKGENRLRARVASAVRMSIAAKGIRFNVQTSAVGAGKYGATLPKYLDGELPGYGNWRHPVFGRDIWTVQHGSPWFFVTLRANQDRFEDACQRALAKVLAEI